MAIARTQPFRGRREIQRRTALVGAAARHHQPLRADDEISLANRRIVLDLHRAESELILAVASASRDYLIAVAKRVRQFRIRLSGLGRGIVYIAAIDDL